MRRVWLFLHRGVNPARLWFLRGQVIFSEGEDITDQSAFYIIISGNVEVSTRLSTAESDGAAAGSGGGSGGPGTAAAAPAKTVVRSSVLRQVVDTSRCMLTLMGPGQTFGCSFFGGMSERLKRSATVSAVSETNLVVISKVRAATVALKLPRYRRAPKR